MIYRSHKSQENVTQNTQAVGRNWDVALRDDIQRDERSPDVGAPAEIGKTPDAASNSDRTDRDRAARNQLTRREIEVLYLVANGCSSKQVADRLCLAKRTIDFHLGNIYVKLHVTNRVQAFRAAARMGLVAVDPQ